MPKFLKRLLRVFLFILATVALIAGGVAIFVNTAPQFGANPEGKHLTEIEKSPNYKEGVFVNVVPSKVGGEGQSTMKILKDFLNAENASPKGKIPADFSSGTKEIIDSLVFLTWYGHSAFLLEMNGKNILIDPMLGPNASPVSFFGTRFDYTQEIDLTALPVKIDAVILSHDHYDHLDYPSIMALKDKVKHFYMPLGMSAHFLRWGIPEGKITELDWWESAKLGEMEFVATPARHFSGRGISNRFKTLWASWVIRSDKYALFFSGDGGYFDGFKEIGNKYGPFDFCMMECGQYNTSWADIHMMPEESVQAHIDLQGKVMMPIHWGAFNLAPHDWTEPVRRAHEEADKKGVYLFTPIVGERFALTDTMQSEAWWEAVE